MGVKNEKREDISDQRAFPSNCGILYHDVWVVATPVASMATVHYRHQNPASPVFQCDLKTKRIVALQESPMSSDPGQEGWASSILD